MALPRAQRLEGLKLNLMVHPGHKLGPPKRVAAAVPTDGSGGQAQKQQYPDNAANNRAGRVGAPGIVAVGSVFVGPGVNWLGRRRGR